MEKQNQKSEQTSGVNSCSICKSPSSTTCSTCKTVYSPCLKTETTDWYIHKYTPCKCENESPEKKAKKVYGIFLPENSDKPVLVELKIKQEFYRPMNCICESVDEKLFLGDGYYENKTLCGNPLKPDKKFTDTLNLVCRDNFLNDGSKSNICVKRITKNRNGYDWKGPLLFLKYKGTNYWEMPKYINAGFDDLPDIIDYFISYGTVRYS